MKKLKKIFIWFIIPILIEMGVLYYINDYFLSSTDTIQIKKVADEDISLRKKIQLNLPFDAKDIKASYDGGFISYILNNELIIVDTNTSRIKKTIDINGETIDYYTWLTDRNRLLYYCKANYHGKEAIQIKAYDLDTNNDIKVDKLIYVPKGSCITNVTLSPLTNMIYINIVDKQGDSMLYRVDIMGKIVELRLPVKRIVRMYETQRNDNLVYESSNNVIRVIKNGSGYTLVSGGYYLIGVDSNDYVYLGKLKNNKITEIYYGSLEEKMKYWCHLAVKEPVDCHNTIIMLRSGNIYNVIGNKDLKDVKTDKILSAYGKIIGVNKNYIIYKENNKVILRLD
ncbi:MAG: hypothetical protein QME35_07205 [Thermoanaerobacteraceae bacterium]|nr:hypothetical protein [Thermoanaerobacteraceae bacterium]